MSSSTKLEGFGGRRMAKRSWKTGAVWPVDAWAFLSASGSNAPAIETLPLILPGLSRDIHLSVLAFLVARRVRFRRIWFSPRLSQDGRFVSLDFAWRRCPNFFFLVLLFLRCPAASPDHVRLQSFPPRSLFSHRPSARRRSESPASTVSVTVLRSGRRESSAPAFVLRSDPLTRCLPARWLFCLA